MLCWRWDALRWRWNVLRWAALAAGLRFIRLATPTTDDARLPAVLTNSSGFVYYVSITGITASAATLGFDTSEAATGRVDFGTSCGALSENQTGASGLTAHSFGLSGLDPRAASCPESSASL